MLSKSFGCFLAALQSAQRSVVGVIVRVAVGVAAGVAGGVVAVVAVAAGLSLVGHALASKAMTAGPWRRCGDDESTARCL